MPNFHPERLFTIEIIYHFGIDKQETATFRQINETEANFLIEHLRLGDSRKMVVKLFHRGRMIERVEWEKKEEQM